MVGLQRDSSDARDHYYVPSLDVYPPEEISLRQDHEQLTSEIYDQLDGFFYGQRDRGSVFGTKKKLDDVR